MLNSKDTKDFNITQLSKELLRQALTQGYIQLPEAKDIRALSTSQILALAKAIVKNEFSIEESLDLEQSNLPSEMFNTIESSEKDSKEDSLEINKDNTEESLENNKDSQDSANLELDSPKTTLPEPSLELALDKYLDGLIFPLITKTPDIKE